MHPLYGARPVRMCQCGLHEMLWSHIGILMLLPTAEHRSTVGPYSAPSVRSDLADPLFGGLGLAGFKSRANAFLLT